MSAETAECLVFYEIIALKGQGLLGERVAEHTLEMLGNQVTATRLNFTADMLAELGKMFIATSEKIKEIVK